MLDLYIVFVVLNSLVGTERKPCPLTNHKVKKSALCVSTRATVYNMDEGRERDNTSRKGGLPSLPGLYSSTIQPSRQGFYRIHVCEGEITGDNIYTT